MLIRQLDESAIARLKRRAKERKTSAEALAREAIHKAAELTVEEKRALVRQMQAKMRSALIPGVEQTPGAELIREDRDR